MRNFIRTIYAIPFILGMVLGPSLPYVIGALITVFGAGFGLAIVLF